MQINKKIIFPLDQQTRNINFKCNVYGQNKFNYKEAKQHVESMVKSFVGHYSSLGYIEQPHVLISSGIDSTVRFIGSQISVLKPYFIDRMATSPGIFMHQNCLRTKNLTKILDDDYIPIWGSYFPNLGAIAPPERIPEACYETFDFIENKIGIAADNIHIRISASDQDLLNICRHRFSKEHLEIDTKPLAYYRHQLGIENVWGRNCNIALRNSDDSGFSDVGNLIILEDSKGMLCLEISIGVSATLKQIYGIDHVQDCTPVVGLEQVGDKFRRKFEDAIITVTVLYREGLRPSSQHNRNRILKSYIQAISYFRIKCNIDIQRLEQIILEFEKNEFVSSNESVSQEIIEYIEAFEKNLMNKENLSKQEKIIKQVFKK